MHLPLEVYREVQREVVDGDHPRIPRDLQVGFDKARPQFDGAAKRRHRILRRVSGGPAMRYRPDVLRSHFSFTTGKTKMCRVLSQSYQTRQLQPEKFE